MMSKKRLFILLLAALPLAAPAYAQHTAHYMAAGKMNVKEMSEDILKYVNEHRAGLKLPPLAMNDYMSHEAETHSHNMATGKVPFSHDGFDDRAQRIKGKLKNINSWAENVAFGTKTARQVVDMWLNSPGHRKNIEGQYNLTGIGMAKAADGSIYFTQIFVNQRG